MKPRSLTPLLALAALSSTTLGSAPAGAPRVETPATSTSAALTPAEPSATPFLDDSPYPESSALAEGLSPDALAAVGELVQSFVDAEEVVGGELLIIKNGRTVLHEAYGFADRETREPLRPGSLFCVRSMTKPLIGASIRMLLEEDRLELDDPVSKFLPSFDVETLRAITVEQLLTHTSGLSMSFIMGSDPSAHADIQAVAALAKDKPLEFEPGTAFNYSDQGTDTLTALIEVVSGMPAADFVRTRLLEPLGMSSSRCFMTEDEPLRAQSVSKYVGGPGAWKRYWKADDPSLFPFFLGSQGLYSTCVDYARFLELYLRKGRANGERLMRASSVRRTLEPGPHSMNGPSGFPNARTNYGRLMQLWTEVEDGEIGELIAFGHTGSDGTHAWAFPEQKAMVLYFTQSRGTLTGFRVEEALGRLLLGAPFDPLDAAPPLEEYLGYYRQDEADLYRAVIRDGEGLALEIMGRAVVPLDYIGEDRWKLRPDPNRSLAFERDGDGRVVAFRVGDVLERRFEPSKEAPPAEELASRVARAHGFERLAEIGPMKLAGSISIEKLGIEGRSTSWLAWPNLWRTDDEAGGNAEQVGFDGHEVAYRANGAEREVFEGERAERFLRENPLHRFGDWSRLYPELRTIQSLERDGRTVWLVRTSGLDGPAVTFYVDEESGRLVRAEDVALIDGVGRLGRRIRFEDVRDVSGMHVPFRIEIEMANPMIGTVVKQIDEFELGVALPEGHFALE